jgi:hypothetical protein
VCASSRRGCVVEDGFEQVLWTGGLWKDSSVSLVLNSTASFGSLLLGRAIELKFHLLFSQAAFFLPG